jgi:hypothetical protein
LGLEAKVQLAFHFWMQIHSKQLTWIFYKNIVNLFLIIFTFSYERHFWWSFLQLVIKNTYSCLNISHVLC